MTKRRRPPEVKGGKLEGVRGAESLQPHGSTPVRAFICAASKIDAPPFERAEKAPAMTAEQAITSLSAAHDRMTDDEIREHALSLAACLHTNDQALADVAAAAAGSQQLAVRQADLLRNFALLTRQAASAIAVGDQATSNSIVIALAIATGNLLDRPSVPPLSEHVPLLDVWPDAFAPEGSKNDS